MKKRFFKYMFPLFVLASFTGKAQNLPESTDTASVASKPGIISKIKNYLEESRRPKPDEVKDFSFLPGPHYSSDTGLGLGIFGMTLYRTDSLSRISSVNTFVDATTKAHFRLGVYGMNYSLANSRRISYDCEISYIRTRFWGIGFDQGHLDSNGSHFRYLYLNLLADYSFRISRNIYIGPGIWGRFGNALRREKPKLWENESHDILTYGPGVVFTYDSRDSATEPLSGNLFSISSYYFPKFIGNKDHFGIFTLQATHYQPLWKGGTLAARIYGSFSFGDTPWTMLPTVADNLHLRGYFTNRYIDKCAAEATLELRQKVYGPHGFVVWSGIGEVFPKFSELTARKALPNFGIGYRYQFKHRVNIRIDYGFGRGESGFIFNINEAF